MKKTLLFSALISCSTLSMADSLMYGGLSVGNSDYRGNSGTSLSGYLGTGILPFLDVEGGIVRHGDFDVYGNDTKIYSLYGAVKPTVALGPIELYGKIGVHAWDTSKQYGDNDNGTDLMYGFGADFSVTRNTKLGLSYMDYEVDSHDVETLGVNVSYEFF